MKQLLSYTALILAMVFTLSSCKKNLDDAGVNPNLPQQVSPNVLLTYSENLAGYTVGGDIARFSGIFDQHIAGASSQFDAYNRYIFSPSDLDNVWQNMYLCMYNLRDLLDSSRAHRYNTYAGVAFILSAYMEATATDAWGDIPYSTAFKGNENIKTPATFDKQQDAYVNIQNMLDSGIARLSAPELSAIVPSSDDVVYGGDKGKWLKLAYSLKARYYLHLRKVDGTATAKATAAAALGFTDNSGDAYFVFGASSKSANPWYQFTQQRTGYISFSGSNLASILVSTSDPRLPALVDTSADNIGTAYNSTSSGIQIMTYAELQFINAEIAYLNGDMSSAAAAHNAGVIASVGYYSPSDTAYVKANAVETAGTITLDKIMGQKYIALAYNPEAFTDWRRTALPSITINANAVTTSIPRRFIYSQAEITANKNNPTGLLLTDRVWWDK